ncbi:MAG: HU family DNA-binding protein [Lachnospiraceae bacterium]|nr:HU family DNA-binding protein [Lachnospiraceae bacterium]
MNRREFVRRIANVMRENNIRKPVSSPKQVFHISDDEGNKKDFVVKKTDKSVLFTVDDVEAVVDACLYVIEESLKRGVPVCIRGVGSLGLKYRKPRATKRPGTEEWGDVEAR